MITVNTFFEKISFKKIVASLVDVMAANFEEFAADQTRFNETITLLENELVEEVSPSVSDVVNSIDQQIGSILLFTLFLGLKANLDHFNDPIGRTFLDVDPEVYLRENVAHQLPNYQNARSVREQFYAALPPKQKEKFEDVSTYISHLETVGPKLAHFLGYVMGNQLFPHVIPGYVVDSQLTLQYRCTLEKYLRISIQHIL